MPATTHVGGWSQAAGRGNGAGLCNVEGCASRPNSLQPQRVGGPQGCPPPLQAPELLTVSSGASAGLRESGSAEGQLLVSSTLASMSSCCRLQGRASRIWCRLRRPVCLMRSREVMRATSAHGLRGCSSVRSRRRGNVGGLARRPRAAQAPWCQMCLSKHPSLAKPFMPEASTPSAPARLPQELVGLP